LEEFLLDVDGRVIRVLIEDARGADGAVPTLVCRAARWAQIVPHTVLDHPSQPEQPPQPGEGAVHFPGLPQAVAERLIEASEPVYELTLNVSDLPSGHVPFAIEDFTAQAAEHASVGGEARLQMDGGMARAWGCELVDT
jgi:hypothetical protein